MTAAEAGEHLERDPPRQVRVAEAVLGEPERLHHAVRGRDEPGELLVRLDHLERERDLRGGMRGVEVLVVGGDGLRVVLALHAREALGGVRGRGHGDVSGSDSGSSTSSSASSSSSVIRRAIPCFTMRTFVPGEISTVTLSSSTSLITP